MTKKDLETFWQEYEEHIKTTSGGQGYLIEDGIDKDKIKEYESQELKVLFVFKESNESTTDKKRHKSLFDPEEWFGSYAHNRSDKSGITKCVKMFKFILAKSSDQNVEIKDIKVDAEDIHKFAYMNISKRGHGEKESDDDYIKSIIKKDAKLLRRQVEMLEPHVIVVGGTNISDFFVSEIIKKSALVDVKVIQIEHFTYLGYESEKNAVKKSFVDQCEDLRK